MLAKDAAKKAAAEVLQRHWDGELPVNPVAIARDLGIDVSFVTFEDADLSGAISATGGNVDIFLAENEPFERQLFTCAHEIGHYIERAAAHDKDYTFKEGDAAVEAARGRGWDLHELYADEFAGNLLMPTDRVRELYESDASVADMADIFSVTRAAVHSRLRRLKNDGVLKPRHA